MKVGDTLYFSPGFRFSDLDFGNPEMIAEAFRDRVEGFYLKPAERCLAANDAFAGGLICCAAIEFIAKVCCRQNPREWLCAAIAEFGGDDKVTGEFWGCFRDGLSHEGRVKRSGQFSLQLPDMLTMLDGVMIVNPRRLLTAVEAAFRRHSDQLRGTGAKALAETLRRYFEMEVNAAKR